MSDELQSLISKGLHTLLKETMFRANKDGGFLLNGGEPGFVDTMKSLSAEQASKSPGPGRKPIVSHANHVLFGWELLIRSIHGDETAFIGADWNAAWKLERMNDAEWQELLGKLEQAATTLLNEVPQFTKWDEMMLTGTYASAAHTAYHIGAIRQILRDL